MRSVVLRRIALAALLLSSTACGNGSGTRPADSPSTPSSNREDAPRDSSLRFAERYIKLTGELNDVHRRLKNEYDAIDEKHPNPRARLAEIARGDLARKRDELQQQLQALMAELNEDQPLLVAFYSRDDVKAAMDDWSRAQLAFYEARMDARKRAAGGK
jgi:hypothetical protein